MNAVMTHAARQVIIYNVMMRSDAEMLKMLMIVMCNIMGKTRKQLEELRGFIDREGKNLTIVQPERPGIPGTRRRTNEARLHCRLERRLKKQLIFGEMCGLKQFLSRNQQRRIIILQQLHQQKLCEQKRKLHYTIWRNLKLKRHSAREEVDTAKIVSIEFPSGVDREAFIMQRRYEQAISSYSFQVQMKQKGFEIDRPSFYKIA